MTKPSIPYSFADAAKRTMEVIDDNDLVRLIGRNWSSQKAAWQDKDNPRLPRIDQALALDLAYASAGGSGLPFFDALETAVSRPNNNVVCMIAYGAGVATFSKDAGEFLAAIITVLQSGASPQAVHRALTELADVDTGIEKLKHGLLSLSQCNAGLGAINAGGIQ